MIGYSYVITRDYGFAPNPFGQYCTLATCKPVIRRCAKLGDIILGISQKCHGNNLIYAMMVEEKLTFNQYWNDPRFDYKKPVMNGSIVQMMGDNIYCFDVKNNRWRQLDSHHSLPGGKINDANVENDTQSNAVLISSKFYYFGKTPIILPESLKAITIVRRSHHCIDSQNAEDIWRFLGQNYAIGLHNEPSLFRKFIKT